MTKPQKLKFCNRTLLILTLIVLASGIQLEATDSKSITFVWIHIILAGAFILFCTWHIALNLKWGNCSKNLQR